ncbi:Kelch domain-containing protein 4 [Glycine max]|nr:Kelch domain-containing protein 4 [Glycine max]
MLSSCMNEIGSKQGHFDAARGLDLSVHSERREEKMGKKTKKPGKGKEKTERKTARAEEKKARRETKKLSPEDDIDAILLSIQKEEAKKKDVQVDDNVPAPSPRSNCSLTVNPLKETELILYGGEFYNGNKTFVYGDLFRYDVEKLEWKLVSSPNSPPPRSAHQAVAWKNYVYIFGGEFTSPNQERFHHYKDFWMLDLKTNQWEQLNLKGCPSPRSGHRMVLYKHKIILFGGFYDTLREVRYYNDLFVFDLDQFKWQEIKPKPAAMWPTARSGFQLFVYQDDMQHSLEQKTTVAVKGISVRLSETASESEWVEASDDDEENEDDDEDESDSDGSTDEDEDDEEEEEEEAQNASVQVVDAVALIKGVGKNLRRKERRSRIEQIRASLGLSDSQRTPLPGESLRDFYRRTNMYWQMAAHEHTQHTGKRVLERTREDPQVNYTKTRPGKLHSNRRRNWRENHDITTFFFTRFPEHTNAKDLWAHFKKWGDVREIFIPNTRNKMGRRYGFARFKGVADQHKLERQLDNTFVVVNDRLCPFCGLKDEEAEHLFFSCSCTLPLWWESISWANLATALPINPRDHFLQHTLGAAGVRNHTRWKCWWVALTWSIWNHRNKIELRKDGFDLAEARYRELKPILDELALLEAEQKAEEAEAPETSAKKRGKKKTRN